MPNTDESPISKPFPYEVPRGATIPKGTAFAYFDVLGQPAIGTAYADRVCFGNRWTQEPIDPREEPQGPIILNVRLVDGSTWTYAFLNAYKDWVCVDGDKQFIAKPTELLSWDTATVTAVDLRDPYDEGNFEPRVGSGGYIWRFKEGTQEWAWGVCKTGHATIDSLRKLNGPLRMATDKDLKHDAGRGWSL